MNNERWLEAYRTNKNDVWVKCMLSTGQEFFISNADFTVEWIGIKSLCDMERATIQELSLQFRSHEVHVDLSDADGVYMAKAAKGIIGGATTEFYVTGVLKDGTVHKDWWQVPELVIERSVTDPVELCFSETMIYYETSKNRQEQV